MFQNTTVRRNIQCIMFLESVCLFGSQPLSQPSQSSNETSTPLVVRRPTPPISSLNLSPVKEVADSCSTLNLLETDHPTANIEMSAGTSIPDSFKSKKNQKMVLVLSQVPKEFKTMAWKFCSRENGEISNSVNENCSHVITGVAVKKGVRVCPRTLKVIQGI